MPSHNSISNIKNKLKQNTSHSFASSSQASVSNNSEIRITKIETTQPRNFRNNEQLESSASFFWRSHPNVASKIKAMGGKISEQLQTGEPSSNLGYMERIMPTQNPTSSNTETYTDSEHSDHKRGLIDQRTVRNALNTSPHLDDHKIDGYRERFQRPPTPSQTKNFATNNKFQNTEQSSAAGSADRKIFSATHPKKSPPLTQKKGFNNLVNHIEKQKPASHQSSSSSIGDA